EIARVSSAFCERGVAPSRFVAHETWPGISAKLRGAAPDETVLVGIERPADPARAVTHHAVALDVAAHARREAPFSLIRVVAGFSGRIAPDALGRVEATAVPRARRAGLGHPDTHVALEAKALFAMTARAPLGGHARLDGVHVQVVVRVNG